MECCSCEIAICRAIRALALACSRWREFSALLVEDVASEVRARAISSTSERRESVATRAKPFFWQLDFMEVGDVYDSLSSCDDRPLDEGEPVCFLSYARDEVLKCLLKTCPDCHPLL